MIYFISHCKTVLFLISFGKIIFFKWFFRPRRNFCRALCFGELGNRKQNSFTPPCSLKDNNSLPKSREVLALCFGATEVSRGPVSSSKKLTPVLFRERRNFKPFGLLAQVWYYRVREPPACCVPPPQCGPGQVPTLIWEVWSTLNGKRPLRVVWQKPAQGSFFRCYSSNHPVIFKWFAAQHFFMKLLKENKKPLPV